MTFKVLHISNLSNQLGTVRFNVETGDYTPSAELEHAKGRKVANKIALACRMLVEDPLILSVDLTSGVTIARRTLKEVQAEMDELFY